VNHTRINHVGLLVFDLDEAVARFGKVLGLTFREPRVFNLENMTEFGQPSRRDLRVALSNEGPTFVELVEAQDDGVWGRHLGEGLHHFGGFQDCLAERFDELDHEGVCADAVMRRDGGISAVYLEPETLFGARVELVIQRDDLFPPG
jgi:catechol 2,3-dioxygenase-like lactoylglutathione lyase family enzyme